MGSVVVKTVEYTCFELTETQTYEPMDLTAQFTFISINYDLQFSRSGYETGNMCRAMYDKHMKRSVYTELRKTIRLLCEVSKSTSQVEDEYRILDTNHRPSRYLDTAYYKPITGQSCIIPLIVSKV